MKKLISCSVMVATLLMGCGDGEDRQAKYLKRAQDYLAEENFDKARIDARNVLQINPKNIEARLVLADISFQEGDIRKAYGMYRGVVDEDAENIDAHIGLIKLYTAVKGYKQAADHADIVLTKEPENTEVMGYKAVALAGLEDIDAAEKLAMETLQRDAGNAPALGVVTQVFINKGDPEAALVLLKQGEKTSPLDDRITLIKIAVLENLGKQSEIEAELVKLAKKHPESKPYSNTLASYYIRESRFADAEKEVRAFAEYNDESLQAKRRVISYLQQHKSQQDAIEQAQAYIDSDPDQSQFYISLAQLYLFTGDQEQGVAILRQAIDRDPRSVGAIEARNMLGQLYVQDDDYAAAKNMFQEVLDIEPENEVALMSRAGLSLADNLLKEGIADLRLVLKNNPENIMALSTLARAQEANGNEGLALDNYKKLMGLQKPDTQTLASAARLAIKSEQYQDAEKYIRQALEQDGENAGLLTNLIRLMVLKEDWDSANDFARRLIDSEESKALGYYLQAGLDLRLEQTESALDNLQASLDLQPEAIESLTSIAKVLSEEKGRDEAITYIQNHCAKYTEQAHCRHILGSLYAQDQQFDRAEAELTAAIKLNEKLVASYRQLAKVYITKGQLDKVEDVFKQGVEVTNNKALRFELAGYYYGTQAFEEAAAAYREIIDVDENTLSAKNNLAMIYAENLNTPENLVKARALIADLQDSDNPAFLDTVGWVMYLSGDYDQAVSYSRAAVDKVGSSALLQYHLGMAYYKLGDTENAKKHLELATQDKEARYIGFDEAVSTLQQL